MWCIPKLTPEFRERMEDVISLCLEPYDPKRPVICLDEKSKQLLADSRRSLPVLPGKTAVQDYEYVRKGTRNIFVAVEPKGGRHYTQVTIRRKKEDYAQFMEMLIEHYPAAKRLRIVQDNLNIHSEKSLVHTFGKRKAKILMKRVEFHPTPKHASWLNMAEIEIGILDRQCLNRRIPSADMMEQEVRAWTEQRNEQRSTINWKFTKEKAAKTFPALYAGT
jgi:DDE superfamily endonuclease